jgi:hypothetical protein
MAIGQNLSHILSKARDLEHTAKYFTKDGEKRCVFGNTGSTAGGNSHLVGHNVSVQ